MSWSDGLVPGTPSHSIAADLNVRIRVVAGPGTGKSYAMKRRVARLLEAGIAPGVILPVTFTRVAAQDLHRELVGMGVPGCAALNAYTLHGLAFRMLARNHVLAATGRIPRPLNKFEEEALIYDLMSAHGGKTGVEERRQAYEAAWARLNNQVPGYAPNAQDAAFQTDLLAWLRFHEAMLIGEVIPELYRYLATNPLAAERSEFAHILVDEFQDLNRAEQAVIELLSNVADVCIIGDDDQSIYSFKHAHPEGIRDWLVANVGASNLGLADCQRCPTRVVAMANALIAHNVQRPVPRILNPLPAKGLGDVRILQYGNLNAEVAGIVTLVQQMVANGTPLGDILILAQSRAVGTPIFEALQAAGVPSRSENTESELGNIQAQWAFALLKLLEDQHDRVALRWLVGWSSGTFNANGYRKIRSHCELTGLSPWQVFSQLSAGTLKIAHTGTIVSAFNQVTAELAALALLPDVASIVDHLFPAGQVATQQIRALAIGMLAAEPAMSLGDLVGELVTAITQPEIPSDLQQVRIMSLHKSKGLSAPVTIIAGCVNGLLPRAPKGALTPAESAAYYEEQRRLFYVGVTRVKADPGHGKSGTLILTYSQQMPLADALGAGIKPAYVNYGTAILQASPYIAEMAPAAPAAIPG